MRGPSSPLEVVLRIVSDINTNQQVMVEPHSVNSVLLDTNNEAYEKLLVAANITESQTSSKIVARDTTIMPNIPGFMALVSLIFCPYMELMRDKLNSRYVSILCGLGKHPETGAPVFPEHDMRIDLDVSLTQDDLKTVILFSKFSII